MIIREEDTKYFEEHYSQLVGCRVVEIAFSDDGTGELWPVLVMKNKKGETVYVEVSCDPEGNAAGHLFINKEE